MCCCLESNSLCVTFVIGKVSTGIVSWGAQWCGVANREKNMPQTRCQNCHSDRCIKNVVRQTPVWRQLIISQTMHCHGNSAMWPPYYLPWILPVHSGRHVGQVRRSCTKLVFAGARFTNVFSIAIQIRWKFRFTLTSILIQWSLQTFVHGTTAVLSWHVQKFVAIWWPATELQQGEFSIEFELRAKNR